MPNGQTRFGIFLFGNLLFNTLDNNLLNFILFAFFVVPHITLKTINMLLNKEKTVSKKKYYLIFVLSMGLTILGAKAFAQGPPPPPSPPNPLSLFKKKKKDTVKKKDTAKVAPVVAPVGPGGPPPPPNPLNLFKRNKKDTTKTPAKPAGS
jgi:hypothetical protein